MISEGSCDTEDWSNDAEISALHHRNKLHIKIKTSRHNETVDICEPVEILDHRLYRGYTLVIMKPYRLQALNQVIFGQLLKWQQSNIPAVCRNSEEYTVFV